MGWRGTLVLALALAAVLLFAWQEAATVSPGHPWQAMFDFRPTPPGDAIERLYAFEAAGVTALTIIQADRRLRTVRSEEGWSDASRPDAVDDLIAAIRDLAEIATMNTEPEGLAGYGLDPPRAVVLLERGAQPAITLLIGDRNPSSTALYVQLGDKGPVALTGALLLWELDKAVDSIKAR